MQVSAKTFSQQHTARLERQQVRESLAHRAKRNQLALHWVGVVSTFGLFVGWATWILWIVAGNYNG